MCVVSKVSFKRSAGSHLLDCFTTEFCVCFVGDLLHVRFRVLQLFFLFLSKTSKNENEKNSVAENFKDGRRKTML